MKALHLLILLFCARFDPALADDIFASSEQVGFSADKAFDQERFGLGNGWQGAAGDNTWTWTVRFSEQQPVGSILLVQGSHDFVLTNAAVNYQWEGLIGGDWVVLQTVRQNQRLYRVDRFNSKAAFQAMRMVITKVAGNAPFVREIEIYPDSQSAVPFPQWLVAVNSTHETGLPGHGQEFIPLARAVIGWEKAPAQQVHVKDFDPDFLELDPKPIAAFLSGSFKDWCEVDREHWRGTQEVLKNRSVPIWASCGGAQALAIIADRGVDQEWDCPHCRDPLNPKIPIYGHIGHTANKVCGDYSGCIFERGPFNVRSTAHDQAFEGLTKEFKVMESHCGQIEYAPKGWSIIAGAGDGTLTQVQCIRMNDYPIYAAHFHIEMEGTKQSSQVIMSNFLGIAQNQQTSSNDLKSKESIRKAMQNVMGRYPGPEKRCDLDVLVESSEDCGEFYRQKISYQSEPGARVPAYLLIPKNASAGNPAPGALTLHQTHEAGHKVVAGLGNSPNDEYGIELVKRGFVCIAPAYPWLAEYAPKLKEFGWESGTMKAIWDNTRALDLLDSLPYVQKGNYAAIGHSLGGHNSLYTAAFDERIKVVVTSCGFDSFKDYMGGNIKGWTSDRYMPKLARYAPDYPFDFDDVLRAIAPRAVFINAPEGDSNFRVASVRAIVEQLKPHYASLNAPDALSAHHPKEGHLFSPEMRAKAYEFIERNLPKRLP